MRNTSPNKASLTKTLQLLAPAVSRHAYIPALQHIRFGGGRATAFNDTLAIGVACADIALDVCIPGALLQKALGTLSGDAIALQQTDSASVSIVSGRSRIKLPCLAGDVFPLASELALHEEGAQQLGSVGDSMLEGLEACLAGVGGDPTHPAQLGVTIEAGSDGRAALYSTDNLTISRYLCAEHTAPDLPGDAPILLPTAFVEQVLALAKAYPVAEITLWLYQGGIAATFDDVAWVFGKLMVDVEPLDFDRVIKQSAPGVHADMMTPLPSAAREAFDRALLVLGDSADRATRCKHEGDTLHLFTTAATGEVTDAVPLGMDPGDSSVGEVFVDPKLILRAPKLCTQFVLMKKALVMTNDSGAFLYLISYVTP